jgi:hypothetical protein
MKLVKNFALAMLLASVLTVSASAGDQHGPAATTPSPTPSPEGLVAYDETPVCDPDTGCLSTETETSDSLFYEALAALLSVY